MEERRWEFWASFSHDRSGLIVLVALAAVLAAVAVNRLAKREGSRIGRVAIGSAHVFAGLAVAAFLLCQAHIPCAKLVSLSTDCFSSVKDLSRAQTLYGEDFDGRFCDGEDWQRVLESRSGSLVRQACAAAEGPVSYAFNRGLAGRSARHVQEPGTTVLIFDAVGERKVAGQGALAVKRHQGRPTIAFVDGHVGSRPTGGETVRW